MSDSRTIRLFVVRHGERQDEAEQKILKKPQGLMNLSLGSFAASGSQALDTFDPFLTTKGHHQAQGAFEKLAPWLAGQKVAVFSSPLRRAIGTARMIGCSKYANTKFHPGIENTETCSDAPIPVTVLNGLGDFAARVNAAGGADYLLKKHGESPEFLPCSGDHKNSRDHEAPTPFSQACTAMPSYQNSETPSSSGTAAQFLYHGGKDEALYYLSWPVRPYHPESLRPQNSPPCKANYPPNFAKKQSKRRKMPCPFEAVDTAVQLTRRMGANVCVVVAHRETIYGLAYDECSFLGALKVDYCGIGKFLVEPTENGRLQYTFHGLLPEREKQTTPVFYQQVPLVGPAPDAERTVIHFKESDQSCSQIAMIDAVSDCMKGKLYKSLVLRWSKRESLLLTRKPIGVFQFAIVQGHKNLVHLARDVARFQHGFILSGRSRIHFNNDKRRFVDVQLQLAVQPGLLPAPAPMIRFTLLQV